MLYRIIYTFESAIMTLDCEHENTAKIVAKVLASKGAKNISIKKIKV